MCMKPRGMNRYIVIIIYFWIFFSSFFRFILFRFVFKRKIYNFRKQSEFLITSAEIWGYKDFFFVVRGIDLLLLPS